MTSISRALLPLLPLLLSLAPLTAAAQSGERLSLAERVTRLEQKSQTSPQQGQANVELLNRITALQGEIQALRSQLEELQNENTQLKERSRAQYVDLDARLQRLESGASTATAPPAPKPEPAKPVTASKPVVATKPAPAVPPTTTANPAVDPAAEQASYDMAYSALIERKEYAEAARGFQAFLRDYPQSRLASNAWYWLGESYYVTQNYQYALESFSAVVNAYPDSRKLPDALFKRGLCEIAVGQRAAGEATLREVVQRYPNHPVAPLARDRLQSLSLQR